MFMRPLKKKRHLPGSHSPSNESLEGKLLLLEIIGSRVFNLELGHGITEGRLDLLLVATLELNRHGGIRDDLLNAGDIRLKLLARLELLGELFIARLELGGIFETLAIHAAANCLRLSLTIDHLFNFSAGKFTDSV